VLRQYYGALRVAFLPTPTCCERICEGSQLDEGACPRREVTGPSALEHKGDVALSPGLNRLGAPDDHATFEVIDCAKR
jgi:hypothetical protein